MSGVIAYMQAVSRENEEKTGKNSHDYKSTKFLSPRLVKIYELFKKIDFVNKICQNFWLTFLQEPSCSRSTPLNLV